MIIKYVSQEIRRIISETDYESIKTPVGDLEMPIGYMNDEEKALFTLLSRCTDCHTALFLNNRLQISFRRLDGGHGVNYCYHCRADFVVAADLDISSLIWRPYTPFLS
jgi:hypothetical protein